MPELSRRERRLLLKEKKKQPIIRETHTKKSGFVESCKNFYTKEYKKLMIIPFLLLFISLGILFVNYYNTGEFISKSVSIKGGISVTIQSSTISLNEVNNFLKQEIQNSDYEARKLSGATGQIGLIIEASDVNSDYLVNLLTQKFNLNSKDITIEVTGSSLGNSFYRQIIIAIIVAFIMMGLVVYIYFRTIIPSLAIMLAAFSDMIIALAVVSLLDIRLTTAGIAAFLMLIGYSVDTDMLLTIRVLKRKEGTVMDRIFSSIKTGMTMNFAALAAVTVSLIFAQSEVIKQIMLILLIGLLADIINTWIQNVGILRWYLERKEKH